MDATAQILRVLNLIEAVALIILNIVHFTRNHDRWRWMKLAFAFNGLIIAWLMIEGLSGHSPMFGLETENIIMMLGVINLLITTLLASTILAFAKLQEMLLVEKRARALTEILKKLEGSNSG